jgi:hypothetical protein
MVDGEGGFVAEVVGMVGEGFDYAVVMVVELHALGGGGCSSCIASLQAWLVLY